MGYSYFRRTLVPASVVQNNTGRGCNFCLQKSLTGLVYLGLRKFSLFKFEHMFLFFSFSKKLRPRKFSMKSMEYKLYTVYWMHSRGRKTFACKSQECIWQDWYIYIFFSSGIKNFFFLFNFLWPQDIRVAYNKVRC